MDIRGIFIAAAIVSVFAFTHVASAQNIGYVVGTDNSGQSFDDGWIARLGSLGYTVTQFTQDTTDPTLATMNTLIVSSDVTSGGFLGGIGLNREQPIITFEYGLFDEIFGTTDNGTTPGVANDISILDAGNPLAAGLSGDVSVYTGVVGGGSRGLLSSVPAGTDVIAGSVADPLQAVMMVLEPGQVGGTGQDGINVWNAVRIAVPGYADWDPTLVTADGWKILDNAVNYAVTTPAVPEPSSFALLGLGMAAMFVRRRNRTLKS